MSQMVGRGLSSAEGMSLFQPVLFCVLFRAGLKGGEKGRIGLCEAGFSSARCIDVGKNTHFAATSCGGGKMRHARGKSTRRTHVMRGIHDIIKLPDRAPTVAHFMWGVHSYGAIPAMALPVDFHPKLSRAGV